jgi:hypothetical protein
MGRPEAAESDDATRLKVGLTIMAILNFYSVSADAADAEGVELNSLIAGRVALLEHLDLQACSTLNPPGEKGVLRSSETLGPTPDTPLVLKSSEALGWKRDHIRALCHAYGSVGHRPTSLISAAHDYFFLTSSSP